MAIGDMPVGRAGSRHNQQPWIGLNILHHKAERRQKGDGWLGVLWHQTSSRIQNRRFPVTGDEMAARADYWHAPDAIGWYMMNGDLIEYSFGIEYGRQETWDQLGRYQHHTKDKNRVDLYWNGDGMRSVGIIISAAHCSTIRNDLWTLHHYSSQ